MLKEEAILLERAEGSQIVRSKYKEVTRKSTPETRGGVPRSWEVPLRLSKGPREEYGPVGED